MDGAMRAGLAAALGGVAAVAIRRMIVRRRWWPRRARRGEGRWHSVTVNRRPQDVSAAPGPAPLERLGLEVEIRYRPAPGGRGTEVSVRVPREGVSQRREIRAALRQAKQLWETGEVLHADGPAQPTWLSRPREYATRLAGQDGRL